MLSTENPSCSSSKPSSASDRVLASGHEDDDHHPHPPIFSIRDYVLKSRNKDIRINWPFREQLLNLCLDNGISDLLPPLEAPNLVRSYCYQRQLESKHLTKCTENKSILGNGEHSSAFVSSDRRKHLLPEEKRESKIQQESIRESDINASSVTSYDLSERISGEQSKKKCRLVVRLSAGIETSTEEGLVANSAAFSDPMASKVCPVCKSFTSSSNTALNAHIDQCLSSDQFNVTRDVAKFPKAKVKPRKKRLMVDIYTTAPHSTLEDLDRRNGTNWAASLAVVTPSNDVNLETRRKKLSPLDMGCDDVNLEPRRTKFLREDIVSNDANLETKRMKLSPVDAVSKGNVGDIYIDSNGTKILILSKFNDFPPLLPRKKFKMKNHGKGFKSGKSCSITKKMILKQKCSDFMKDNQQSRKLSVVKGFYGEMEEATEGDHISEDHEEREESGSQLVNANDHVKSSEPSTIGHWVCSKRSEISRKQAHKDINRGSEKMIVTARKLSFRRSQPDSIRSSIQRNCALNLPSSSEAVASPKTKCTNILSNTFRGMDSRRKISLRSSNLNSKFSEDGYLVDDPMVRISCPSVTYHPPSKGRKSLSSKRSCFPRRTCVSLEGMDEDKGPRFITLEKIRKHRSILVCSKGRGGEKYYNVNGGSDGPSEDFGPISLRSNEASDIHDDQSDLSDNQEKRSLGMTDPIRSPVTAAPAHDIHLEPRNEEQVESLSRDGTHVEVQAQGSTSYEAAQCGDVVSNEVISQEFQRKGDEAEPILHHGEFQTDASSFHEPDLWVTSDGEVALEAIQENSSTNLVRVESNKDHCMIIDMKSSGSAVSTISAISPASPMEDKIKDPEAGQLAEYNPAQGKMSSPIVRKDNNVKVPPPPTEPSCSCSKSLARESQFSNHRKSTISSLFIKPSAFSSFQLVCPSLESYTESTVTMDSSKAATNASTPCSGSQSASNPILRLMGKDLVVSKEGSVHLPTILSSDSQAKYISFAPPSNIGFISYHNPYSYPIQSLSNHQIPIQPLQMRSDKLNPPSSWGMNRMIAPQHPQPRSTVPSYPPPREVIVIDDDSHGLEAEPRTKLPTLLPAVENPNIMASQRPFACFPCQNPYASRASVPSQREASEGVFMFPSPSSLYFSPTLR